MSDTVSTERAPPPGKTALPASRPLLALGATLGAQVLVCIALTTPSVLAPAVAPLLGLAPGRIGLYIGLCYLCAMLSGLLFGDRVASVGPVRVTQIALGSAALGLAVAASGSLAMLAGSALAIGFAYGLTNPAASVLLGEHAPPARRGLFFSIKQAAVPIGVALTGLVVPSLYLGFGWQTAVLVAGALCAFGVVALAPTRSIFDREALTAAGSRTAAGVSGQALRAGHGVPAAIPTETAAVSRYRRHPWRLLVDPLRIVFRDPPLRSLAMVSFAFAMTQVCFLTFLVSYLNIDEHFSLTVSAGILTAAQAVSIVARIGWGHVADRWIPPVRLLPMLAFAMALACVFLGVMPGGPSVAVAASAALLCGLTAVGWNGVFFAELARVSPPGKLGAATGASQFLTFCGGMVGPVAFGQSVDWGIGYGPAFVGLAALPALTGIGLLPGLRRTHPLPTGRTRP